MHHAFNWKLITTSWGNGLNVSASIWFEMRICQKGSKLKVVIATLPFLLTLAFAQTSGPADPSAPLRHFPISLLVTRPGLGRTPVSLLHIPALQPKDQVEVEVDPHISHDWTFVSAFVSAGSRSRAEAWNLWDKRREKRFRVAEISAGQGVPMFFLVLNRKHDGRVGDAVRHALESSSEAIVSDTASFETTYQQQEKVYNFLSAYASLGPKGTNDPVLLRDRIYKINADLGCNYDPNAATTSPGELERGLNAGVGLLTQLRTSPDDQTITARIVQNQLPTPVADWLGLASSLVKVFIHPRSDLKVSFVPASATEVEPMTLPSDRWMQLVTERVPETKDGSLPSLVYRPVYDPNASETRIPFQFAVSEVFGSPSEVAIPLAPESRELFAHPWSWGYEASVDGSPYVPLDNAHLAPGRGLVFSVTPAWWGTASVKSLMIRSRFGFRDLTPQAVKVYRSAPQTWSLAPSSSTEYAAGDQAVTFTLNSATGPVKPVCSTVLASLTDAAGKSFLADSVTVGSGLNLRFNLANVAPGIATIRIQQDLNVAPDPAVAVVVPPSRPNITIQGATGDRLLRVKGPDLNYFKSIFVTGVNFRASSGTQSSWDFELDGPLPKDAYAVVTFRDPARGIEWTRNLKIGNALVRPRIDAKLVGEAPNLVNIGAGPDPSWAQATLPTGWFRAKQPLRLQLNAVAPYTWTHDSTLELGFGSSGDVERQAVINEGPSFALDAVSPAAFLTLDIDGLLPKDAKRNSGLIWVRVMRGDLVGNWTLAYAGDSALRAVRLPTISAIDASATRTRITFMSADQVLGVKVGSSPEVVPQLIETTPQGLTAAVDLPAGTMEFDLVLRDASDGVVHVKLLKLP